MEMDIVISDAAVNELAKAGFDPVYGARPLKRAIQQQIENPLSKAILEGKFGPKDTIRVDAKGGVFSFEVGGVENVPHDIPGDPRARHWAAQLPGTRSRSRQAASGRL
jgi:ATP-dependent Clp protease ATP-binding subunit ClpB